MRTGIVLAGWLWFIAALPQFTDASIDFFPGIVLFLSGPVIALVWLVYPVANPKMFRATRWEWATYLSVPVAGLLPVLLLVTGWGFAVRVAVSEPILTEFAEAVREGRDVVKRGDPPRRVGLFLVMEARNDEREVIIITSRGFLDGLGLAYCPEGPPDPPRGHAHLEGPWYWFQDKF